MTIARIMVQDVYLKHGQYQMNVKSLNTGSIHSNYPNDNREDHTVFVKDKFLSDVNHALESGQ